MFGVCVFNVDWIKFNFDCVVICDVMFVVFVQDMEWEKFDVVIYSWQKIFGGEVVYGMLILLLNVV